MKSNTQDSPLACNMNVFTTAERENHIQNTAELFQSVQAIQEADNGYEFIFPNPGSPATIVRMAEFISNERLCCPFLKFTLTIDTDPKPVSLILIGPEGTQDFLRAEFSEAFA